MSFNITGDALIGGAAVKGNGGSFEAWDPAVRAHIAPAFHMVDAAQIDTACRLAQAAFDPFRATSDAKRADVLDTIAAQIGELGVELIVRAMTESGLPRVRRLQRQHQHHQGDPRLVARVRVPGADPAAQRDVAVDHLLLADRRAFVHIAGG